MTLFDSDYGMNIFIITRELVRNTWTALGQAGSISKPGLCARYLVLIDVAQSRFNYCNGSLHHPIASDYGRPFHLSTTHVPLFGAAISVLINIRPDVGLRPGMLKSALQ